MRDAINKQDLYESVKTLVETDAPHIHLNQHKLYTLFSIGFQYLLYQSTKNPGAYVLRIEDSHLAEKIYRKAKDESTRKFLQSLLIPRKLKYGKSMFYLDFFHLGTWNMTKDIPKEKLKGALIVKNTTKRPMNELVEAGSEEEVLFEGLPENYFLTSLTEFVPRTLTISFEDEFEDLEIVRFPFIKKEAEKTVSGVTLSNELDWDKI
ncbi:hypothetical protein HBN50_08795 [Halobacteriovorax sp. GB3]|uniref:hypothetical protein n=1 Tax=Halobacteriovorax sp. GB3 TaxID=2719615 RepID=UPI0023605E68|nr:hypothetical protein [Halobacteriovorax sp. GB3]MDD0853193.1 hypothetical protein [Halobacteriovorax sp. GB3]